MGSLTSFWRSLNNRPFNCHPIIIIHLQCRAALLLPTLLCSAVVCVVVGGESIVVCVCVCVGGGVVVGACLRVCLRARVFVCVRACTDANRIPPRLRHWHCMGFGSERTEGSGKGTNHEPNRHMIALLSMRTRVSISLPLCQSRGNRDIHLHKAAEGVASWR